MKLIVAVHFRVGAKPFQSLSKPLIENNNYGGERLGASFTITEGIALRLQHHHPKSPTGLYHDHHGEPVRSPL